MMPAGRVLKPQNGSFIIGKASHRTAVPGTRAVPPFSADRHAVFLEPSRRFLPAVTPSSADRHAVF